jgi:hypothetical protein
MRFPKASDSPYRRANTMAADEPILFLLANLVVHMFLWKQSTMRLSSLGFLAVFASLVAGAKYDNSAKCW